MQVVDHHLEEVPGLYGGLRIEEKILQRIWKEGLFNQQNLKTECGKLVQIIDPGTWNQGEEGPDFKNAVLQMNENKIFGDIEVHFHGKDWERHGHHKDENFKKVILQVCLFPDDKIGTGKISCSASKTLPQLTLLSKLFKGLEEYGEQWAIEALADYNSSQKGPKKPAGIEKNIFVYAFQRWTQKRNFASKRIKKKGWNEACHQWFLEILGYPRNKKPMHEIAEIYPLTEWDKEIFPEKIYVETMGWKTKGMRPANRPVIRLQQYKDLMSFQPTWVNDLKHYTFPESSNPETENRNSLSLSKLSLEWQRKSLHGLFSKNKANTLMVDCCLPLWSSFHDIEAFAAWYHWPCGDFPDSFKQIADDWGLKHTGESLSNGTQQGIMQHLLLDRIRSSAQ